MSNKNAMSAVELAFTSGTFLAIFILRIFQVSRTEPANHLFKLLMECTANAGI